MFPLLSLSRIHVDSELARRLPRRLAYYHLALPIAQDDDNITVAMAYPENQRVVEVISTTLGVPVTPVRSPADEIRRALDEVWQQSETDPSRLMCWADVATQQQAVETYAQGIAEALSLNLQNAAHESSLQDFIQQVSAARPKLAVCEVAHTEVLAYLLAQLPTSILLLRGSFEPPASILQVLRGHTPDKRTLDWIIPIALHYAAQVSLLAAATSLETHTGSPLMSDAARLILPEHPVQVVEYGTVLASVGLHGRIKIGEGALEDLLIEELANTSYGLVAIATEAYGAFVHRILQRTADKRNAFLILKP